MNRFRYISGNATSQTPTNLLFVDTEAHIKRVDSLHSELNLRLWCAETVRLEKNVIRSNRYYSGKTAVEFWRLVYEHVQSKKPLWIFAHNAKYDMRQLELWSQFDDFQLRYIPRTQSKKHGIMAIDNHPWFIKCHHKTGAVVWIVDTLNYWQDSLEELGESVGLPKLEIDFDKATDTELFKYCVRDVEIIKTLVVNLITNWKGDDNGCFRTSAAGLSMQNFRHLCCETDQKRIRNIGRYNIGCDIDSEETILERSGFFGGRIEAFFIGTYRQKCYHLDVKSMYPSIMKSGYYPLVRMQVIDTPQINQIKCMVPAYGALAEVLINSHEMTYPLRKGNRQLHCNGKFWTILCGQELQRALYYNHAIELGKTILYRTAPLFREWIQYWLDRRRESEKNKNYADADLCKLIVNSLYGKFAQRGIKWQDFDCDVPILENGRAMRWGMFTHHDYETKQTMNCRMLDGKPQVEMEGEPPAHCFPAISAMISADVREHMRALIELCPLKSVLYTAVDSLIVTQAGFDALFQANKICKGKIGKLQIIGRHNECEIVSQGCYRLDDKWTVSGLWGKATPDDAGHWQALQWSYNDLLHFEHNGTVYIDKVTIDKPQSKPKGKKQADGWIQPIEIGMTDDFYRLSPQDQMRLIAESED